MTEPTGYTALDLIGFTDQGTYDSTTAYVQNDLVHYDDSIWRCLIDDTTGQTPAEGDYWTIFVEATGGSGASSADAVTYDNTSSGLTAENVQDAIDEVVTDLSAKQDTLTFDTTPTESSTNPVTSGGVYTENENMRSIISDAYDSSTTYAAGDYFIYDNVLYYVDVACTGITPPNTSYYTATTVSSEISNNDKLLLSNDDVDSIVLVNKSISYNSSYTAPSDGLYLLYGSTTSTTIAAVWYLDSDRTIALPSVYAGAENSSMTCLVPLKAGTTVYSRNTSSTSYKVVWYKPF